MKVADLFLFLSVSLQNILLGRVTFIVLNLFFCVQFILFIVTIVCLLCSPLLWAGLALELITIKVGCNFQEVLGVNTSNVTGFVHKFPKSNDGNERPAGNCVPSIKYSIRLCVRFSVGQGCSS